MIDERVLQEGGFHLSDKHGQLIAVPYGSSHERIWRNRETIFELLKLQVASDSEQLAVFIQMAGPVQWFEWARYNNSGLSRASRRETLSKLSNALFAVILGLRDLDNGSRIAFEDSMDFLLQRDYSLAELSDELSQLREHVAGYESDYSNLEVGRSKDEDLRDLILSLANIFETCVGKKATKPYSRANKKEAYDSHEFDGPFYRFCRAVVKEIDEKEVPKLPHAISAALKT